MLKFFGFVEQNVGLNILRSATAPLPFPREFALLWAILPREYIRKDVPTTTMI